MIFKAPQMGVSNRVRVTFCDPETGKRIAAANAETGVDEWGGVWHPNLITDFGLDMLAQENLFADNSGIFQRLSALGDLAEIKESSGSVTATQEGTTVTASAAFFQASDVGKAIVWADGSNARIVAFTSANSVQVDKSQGIAAQAFERWHVDIGQPTALETSLSAPVPPTTDTGFSPDAFVIVRSVSRVLTLEQNRNVSGVALGPQTGIFAGWASVVENIRDAAGNAITVSMLAGKSIRVDWECTIRVPRVEKHGTLTINEYDAANQLIGEHEIPVVSWPVITTDTPTSWLRFMTASNMGSDRPLYNLAAPAPVSGVLLQAPTLTPGESVIPTSTLSNGLESPYSEAGNVAHRSEYVAGSRRIAKEVEFGAARQVGEAHGIVILNASLSGSGTANRAAFVVQFTDGETFTKEDTHTLRVGLELTWDRDYTVS